MKLAETEEEVGDSQMRPKFSKKEQYVTEIAHGTHFMFLLAEMVGYSLYRSFLIIIQS